MRDRRSPRRGCGRAHGSACARRTSRETALHPDLSKRLTLEQLDEALEREGLFGDVVQLEDRSYPVFFVRFTTVTKQERLLRFDARNYDFEPLDVEPVDPVTRGLLESHAWMKRAGQSFPPHP